MSSKKIKEGDKMPLFSLPDQDGQMTDIGKLVGHSSLVIYFYPKDFTSGCTMEAHEFREMHEEFQKGGAEVFGISGDSVRSHKDFATEHELPFRLLSDEGDKVRDLFGAWSLGGIPGRITYLVDMAGVVRLVFSSMTQPKKHIEEGLKALHAVGSK
ncbi:MAG: peroxiredoxin [Methanomassiliicoccales archaeon]